MSFEGFGGVPAYNHDDEIPPKGMARKAEPKKLPAGSNAAQVGRILYGDGSKDM